MVPATWQRYLNGLAGPRTGRTGVAASAPFVSQSCIFTSSQCRIGARVQRSSIRHLPHVIDSARSIICLCFRLFGSITRYNRLTSAPLPIHFHVLFRLLLLPSLTAHCLHLQGKPGRPPAPLTSAWQHTSSTYCHYQYPEFINSAKQLPTVLYSRM